MIEAQEEVEQPGKNAIEHPCEMKVEIPGDDGEPSSFKKCRILALVQCETCAAWLCGNEELMHAIICIKCDGTFCPADYDAHRRSKDCEQMTEEPVTQRDAEQFIGR
jgi:hypothetical protein